MAFNLDKNEKFNLSKASDSLRVIRAELGWDSPDDVNGVAFDLDVSLFGLNNARLVNPDYFVFYNHANKAADGTVKTSDGAITKSPDELTGGTEWMKVVLGQVNKTVDELAFFVTIHKADTRNQSFGQVKDAYITIFNDETNEPLCTFKLDKFNSETAIQVGSLVREGDEWAFQAVGVAFKVGLQQIIDRYYVG